MMINTLCPAGIAVPRRKVVSACVSEPFSGNWGKAILSRFINVDSVSFAEASMKMGMIADDSLGKSPAFTSDDLPEPLGPYTHPNANVSAAWRASIRAFINRIISGMPSWFRGPGTSSRKKPLSLESNDRRPLGTIAAGPSTTFLSCGCAASLGLHASSGSSGRPNAVRRTR